MTEKVATGRRWIAPVALAALLIVAAGLGMAQPGNFVAWDWLDQPVLFGPLAFGLLALAAWLALRDRVWRLVATSLLLVFALGVAAIGALASSLQDDLRELSRHRSPGGGHELVVYRGANIIDPTWELRLRSGSGPAEREWDLGCVNSDVESVTGVEWTGPHELRVGLARRGTVDVTLDASTGQPSTRLSEGC